MRLNILVLAAAAAGLVAAGPARAAAVNTFFNTGVDANHAVAANNAAELHYSLVSTPDGSAPGDRVATSANGYPFPNWVGDDSLSAWVGPKTDASLDGAAGNYDYRTTFDLTGFNASTASLSGKWAFDDNLVNVVLNGVSLGITASGYSSFSLFTLASGFISGINTLDFIVNNGSGPTGLRVEASLTATAIPEPASLALLATGLLAGVALRRRS